MKKVTYLFLFLIVCPVIAGIFCYGQPNMEDRWRANVEAQLERVSTNLRSRGFSRSLTYIDSIRQGDQQYVDVILTAHTSYGFVGVCDQDCSDLDLYLRDDSGYLVDSDTSPDDTPTVVVTPARTGTFRLYIKMVRCSNGPCRWGVGVYQ